MSELRIVRLARTRALCAMILFIVCPVPAQTARPHVIRSAGNPILSDGSYYSADPAPLVVGDSLYILAGRDEAAPAENDFVMNEWQLFQTHDWRTLLAPG